MHTHVLHHIHVSCTRTSPNSTYNSSNIFMLTRKQDFTTVIYSIYLNKSHYRNSTWNNTYYKCMYTDSYNWKNIKHVYKTFHNGFHVLTGLTGDLCSETSNVWFWSLQKRCSIYIYRWFFWQKKPVEKNTIQHFVRAHNGEVSRLDGTVLVQQ